MKPEYMLDKVLLCQYMAERAGYRSVAEKLAELYQELGAYFAGTTPAPYPFPDSVKPDWTKTVNTTKCSLCEMEWAPGQVMSYHCPRQNCPCGFGGISCAVDPHATIALNK